MCLDTFVSLINAGLYDTVYRIKDWASPDQIIYYSPPFLFSSQTSGNECLCLLGFFFFRKYKKRFKYLMKKSWRSYQNRSISLLVSSLHARARGGATGDDTFSGEVNTMERRFHRQRENTDSLKSLKIRSKAAEREKIEIIGPNHFSDRMWSDQFSTQNFNSWLKWVPFNWTGGIKAIRNTADEEAV